MAAPLVGIDLSEPARLRDRLARTPGLAEELFHLGERAYCGHQRHPEQHLAARFSAKEAVIKALHAEFFAEPDPEVFDVEARAFLVGA